MIEIVEFFKKCGRIAKESSGELKIKLYTDEEGKLKGDCRVCYENFESVEMAIELLNLS
jgi:RNA recognition motif-containing protein